jgi:hypothetical protein
MSKKVCKLEKETSSWKQRWEKSHQALLEMAADKQQRDSELALATRQLAQLQKLCRTLQAERTSLLAQLKAEGTAKTAGEGWVCCCFVIAWVFNTLRAFADAGEGLRVIVTKQGEVVRQPHICTLPRIFLRQ